MDGVDLNLLEKLRDYINNFSFKNIGDVITLCVVACLLIIPLVKALYRTAVEEIYLDSKQRRRNVFWSLFVLLIIFCISNFFLLIDSMLALPVLSVFGIVGFIVHIVYDRKEAGTKKYLNSISKLNVYYKEKASSFFLLSVICLTPCMCICILLNKHITDVPLFNIAVIASIIEVLIICISIPEFINRSAKIYFIDDNKKVFIYKRIDDDMVLCGEHTEISKAKKYTMITYEQLKEKEMFRLQNENLSKTKKRKLRKKYKSKRAKEKSKSKKSDSRSKDKKGLHLCLFGVIDIPVYIRKSVKK